MKTTLTIAMLLLILCTFTKAQEISPAATKSADTTKSADRVFGIGLKTFNLLSDAGQNTSVLPGNKIIVTINVLPNFRIQPEFGFNHNSEHSDEINDDLINKSISLGIGMYGMWKRDKTNLYMGLKYISLENYTDEITSNYNPNPPFNTTYIKTTTNISYSTFGIVFGGEYLISSHFSIGSEVAFLSSDITNGNSNSNGTDKKSSSSMTETNLLIRFYF